MKASASGGAERGPEKGIDGIIDPIVSRNMFYSSFAKHNWFAVDLGNYYNVQNLQSVFTNLMFSFASFQVHGITIVNRVKYVTMNNIQVRVGYLPPPTHGTYVNAIIDDNPNCGDLYVGPALNGENTTITCNGQILENP